MDYLENENKFYSSDYATLIVDAWITGIPFFMVGDSGIYDAFMFYSIDDRHGCYFDSVRMLVGVNAVTGEVEDLMETMNLLDIGINFSFEYRLISDINKCAFLRKELCDVYTRLRNHRVMTGRIDPMIQSEYIDLAMKIVPIEIIDKVYKPLSPCLFTGG